MLKKRFSLLILFTFFMLLIGGLACSDSTTDTGSYNVTLNLTLTEEQYAELDSNTVTLYLLDDENDTTYLYSGDAELINNEAEIVIDSVAGGDYTVIMVLNYDGSVNENNILEQGDYFWGALDVDISSDLTITIDDGYMQEYHSIVSFVRGIPSGHTGQLLACAIMNEGADYWDLANNMIMASVVTLYNQTAIMAPTPSGAENDSAWENYDLPSGEYDMFLLLDHDGEISDYDDDLDIYSDGDYYYIYDYTFDADDEDTYSPSFSADFDSLEISDTTLIANSKLNSARLEQRTK